MNWSKSLLRLLHAASIADLLSFEAIRDNHDINRYLQKESVHRYEGRAQFGAMIGTGAGFALELQSSFGNRCTSFQYSPHHLTHAATACYTSPFSEALCLIVDGEGEASSSIALYHYTKPEIRLLKQYRPPCSLGNYYELLTTLCGFRGTSEEWKTMGLASYGKVDMGLYSVLRSLFKVEGKELRLARRSELRRAAEFLGGRRRRPEVHPLEAADLAHTGQKVFADVMTEILSALGGFGNLEEPCAWWRLRAEFFIQRYRDRAN